MTRFTFYNIQGLEWLNMSILASSASAAVRRFNEMMPGTKYTMSEGGPFNGSYKLASVVDVVS